MEKVTDLTRKLKVGKPNEVHTNVAAVINQKSFDNAAKYIKIGKNEGGEVIVGGRTR